MNQEDVNAITSAVAAAGAVSTTAYLELVQVLFVYIGRGDQVGNPFEIVYPEGEA